MHASGAAAEAPTSKCWHRSKPAYRQLSRPAASPGRDCWKARLPPPCCATRPCVCNQTARRIQECHAAALHIVCGPVKRRLHLP